MPDFLDFAGDLDGMFELFLCWFERFILCYLAVAEIRTQLEAGKNSFHLLHPVIPAPNMLRLEVYVPREARAI